MTNPQTTLWQEGYRCTGCGNLSYGRVPHDFCPACGDAVNHEKVALKVEHRMFCKDRITVKPLKKPTRFMITPAFCAALASIMDVEIDGGDCAADYVKDCLYEAYQRNGTQ